MMVSRKYFVLAALLLSSSLLAQKFNVESGKGFSEGRFVGTRTNGDGALTLGHKVRSNELKIEGSISALVGLTNGDSLVATLDPARLYRVSAKEKTKLLFKSKLPVISDIVALPNNQVAVLTGPAGGVHVLDVQSGKEAFYLEMKEVGMLLQGQWAHAALYLVGGGSEGLLLRLNLKTKKIETLQKVRESHLRSLLVAGKKKSPQIWMGGAHKGLLYKFQDKKLQTLAKFDLAEVNHIIRDKKGRLFVSLLDSKKNTGKETSGKAKNAETAAAEKESEDNKIAASQVVRVDLNGLSEVIWSSKKFAAYGLVFGPKQSELWVTTGPTAKVFAVQADLKRKPSLLVQLAEKGDVVGVINTEKSAPRFFMANPSAMAEISKKPAAKGTYYSKSFEAPAASYFGNVRGAGAHLSSAQYYIRAGNTEEPDETWGDFKKIQNLKKLEERPKGRFGQFKVILEKSGKKVPKLLKADFHYRVMNRSPKVLLVKNLSRGMRLVGESDPRSYATTAPLNQEINQFVWPQGIEAFEPIKPSRVAMTFEPGFQSIQVRAQDLDGHDVLSYSYLLERLDKIGKSDKRFQLLKTNTLDSFVTFDTKPLPSGRYRVKVSVNDQVSNPHNEAHSDSAYSPIFEVSKESPVFAKTWVKSNKKSTRIRFEVSGPVPLLEVRCSNKQGQWQLLAPKDGLYDSNKEEFSETWKGAHSSSSITCLAIDENFAQGRVELKIR